MSFFWMYYNQGSTTGMEFHLSLAPHFASNVEIKCHYFENFNAKSNKSPSRRVLKLLSHKQMSTRFDKKSDFAQHL